MRLITEPYLTQVSNWPENGRHILAQYDDHSIVVYSAYRPDIGNFAATYDYLGGEFSFDRMSWIRGCLKSIFGNNQSLGNLTP